MQKEDGKVRPHLRNLVDVNRDHYEQLNAVFKQLDLLAESPGMSRTDPQAGNPDQGGRHVPQR